MKTRMEGEEIRYRDNMRYACPANDRNLSKEKMNALMDRFNQNWNGCTYSRKRSSSLPDAELLVTKKDEYRSEESDTKLYTAPTSTTCSPDIENVQRKIAVAYYKNAEQLNIALMASSKQRSNPNGFLDETSTKRYSSIKSGL